MMIGDFLPLIRSHDEPFFQHYKRPWRRLATIHHHHQCDQKKSPNVYKSCPKMISLKNL